jgi:phospholipid transport system substrate-binding protein
MHHAIAFKLSSLMRRVAVLAAFALALTGATAPAQGATPAETYVSDNIQKALSILDDKQLAAGSRDAQFESFLLGITDMHRIATFTLGPYGPKASQADRDAFAAAFQNYAVAVYQSYLGKYSGQTLKVTGSNAHAADDVIVTTTLIDPNDRSGRPLEVDFRVRSDTGKPVIVDFSVAGIWLAIEERDQFTAFLGQNGGSVPALIAHLDELRTKIVAAN